MCGIAGLLGTAEGQWQAQCLQRLTALLSHRGPDGQGTWTSPCGRVGLGHTRLSILDLSAAASQPMRSADNRYCIVFNGEIYNFLELAEELRQAGVVFRSRSDTEVLLEGFRHWQHQLWNRLNGMWAVAIHDCVTGQTVLCRDRFGVKPLFFLQQPDRPLIFASEASAIDRLLHGRLTPDARWLQQTGTQDTGDRSCYSEVRSLRAGELLIVSPDGQLQSKIWYRMQPVECPATFAGQAQRFRELLIDACRLRLRSDVPVATCLSGGLDSGSLVALLHKYAAADPRFAGFNHRSFNAAFPGTQQDESAAASRLATECGVLLDCHTINCPSPAELENALLSCDGPMPCMAFYPIWQLYRYIRQQGVVVTLDGMGPDEYLGGYYIGQAALHGAWETGSISWFRDVRRTYAALYQHGPEQTAADARVVLRTGLSRLKRRLFRRPALPGPGARFPIGVIGEQLEESGLLKNTLARCLFHQVTACPLPYLLHQYDRCSMANGVESRFPFMDYRLLEFAFSLPLQSRVGGGYTKRVLREAVAGALPDAIRLNKRKTGFNSPFSDWLKGPLRDWVGDLASSQAFRESSFFDGGSLSRDILHGLSVPEATLREWDVWMPLHLTWWLQNKRSLMAAGKRVTGS
ncbi:asparagine synthetase B [Planctomycetia bacterium]|nr:asparagine synthetase B [Planctomycetia bacterium]